MGSTSILETEKWRAGKIMVSDSYSTGKIKDMIVPITIDIIPEIKNILKCCFKILIKKWAAKKAFMI
ncbi:MAG: hypothetical protein OHK0036_08880 [Bacteroidia bacterium]